MSAEWYEVEIRVPEDDDRWWPSGARPFRRRWTAAAFTWLYGLLLNPPEFRIVRVRADGSREVVG